MSIFVLIPISRILVPKCHDGPLPLVHGTLHSLPARDGAAEMNACRRRRAPTTLRLCRRRSSLSARRRWAVGENYVECWFWLEFRVVQKLRRRSLHATFSREKNCYSLIGHSEFSSLAHPKSNGFVAPCTLPGIFRLANSHLYSLPS